jgi:hypothetical protein
MSSADVRGKYKIDILGLSNEQMNKIFLKHGQPNLLYQKNKLENFPCEPVKFIN